MTDGVRTEVGDVLILEKDDISAYVVGAVSKDGQQVLIDDYKVVWGREAAVVAAKELVMPGRRIYLKDDTGIWSRLPE